MKNKRIKELAYTHDIDAERLLAEMVCFSGEGVDRVISEYMCSHPEALQKLRDRIDAILDEYAELIIRECAEQCTTDGPFVAEVVWGKQFHKKILEHFGVEE